MCMLLSSQHPLQLQQLPLQPFSQCCSSLLFSCMRSRSVQHSTLNSVHELRHRTGLSLVSDLFLYQWYQLYSSVIRHHMMWLHVLDRSIFIGWISSDLNVTRSWTNLLFWVWLAWISMMLRSAHVFSLWQHVPWFVFMNCFSIGKN